MGSRRRFLMAGAAGVVSVARGWAARTNGTAFPYEEFEARIARRDFRDITKDVLPTPSMVVDLDLFQSNVKRMADQAKLTGIQLRPHVKVHKSVDVARRQITQGAIGLTCATIAEAELFSGAGIKNVLWTKQPASVNNVQRAVALSRKDPTWSWRKGWQLRSVCISKVSWRIRARRRIPRHGRPGRSVRPTTWLGCGRQ